MQEIRINPELAQVLIEELEAERPNMSDDVASGLAEALRAGVVPRPLLEHLGELIERSYLSGRLRARHGPHAEMALVRMYRHTPQGERIVQSLESLNKGLQALAGQQIESVAVSCSGPSTYDISIDTNRCQVRIELTPKGARVKSIELGI